MTTQLIITLCSLLILAFVFDVSASKTKIPTVILLLSLGFGVSQLTQFLGLSIPNLTPILPILGTIGLILIVLEGSLELEINNSKISLISKSSVMALIPLLLISFGLAFAFQYWGNTSLKTALTNAIPFAVISSAIAIPSAQNLPSKTKEFITYESSLSDIFGVLFFNFIALNKNIDNQSFINFGVQLIITLLLTFIATISLAALLGKIKHHVKFTPIILITILIYSIAKVYHLPGLLFILIFGLFLGNIKKLQHSKIVKRLKPEILSNEIHKFKELTTELTFLIRALFFLLFGFLIEPIELLNTATLAWSVSITFGIFILRFIFLNLFKIPSKSILYIAPRGLITILLFLSIPAEQTISVANKSLVLQVIILSAFTMMFGLMLTKTENHEADPATTEKNDSI